YTKTAYEIQSENLGSQNALGGGGRYDLLTESLGGKPTPAVGFAAGIERLIIVMEAENLSFGEPPEIDVYLVVLGDVAVTAAMPYVQTLRQHNITCEIDYLKRSMKAQMRDANRQKAKFTVILGDNEIAKKECVVKNMDSGEQTTIALAELDTYFQKKFS
ncbi:ATP phosphoribosyltransferase regulatory subunit, partial [bacterium]|nr:ATP phosphoribosyltransferase regulatory subunit [bacterium]